jgi:hypothetical protein
MKERWKPIAEYHGYYEVSDHGRVRSISRIDAKNRFRQGRILALINRNAGYKYVGPSYLGRQVIRAVHHLVLEAFVGKRPSPEHVGMHKDDNPSNNYYKNLKWGTNQENTHDKYIKGRTARGEGQGTSVLKNAEVLEIYYLAWQGVDQRTIAKRYGVHQSLVSLIKLGKNWTHITGHKTKDT